MRPAGEVGEGDLIEEALLLRLDVLPDAAEGAEGGGAVVGLAGRGGRTVDDVDDVGQGDALGRAGQQVAAAGAAGADHQAGALELEQDLGQEAEGDAMPVGDGLDAERLRLAVDELSNPILELWDDVLAMPVIGLVDSRRTADMVRRLLAEVARTQASFVIVDLTGVEIVDTKTADHLIKLMRKVEIVGARCVLTGVRQLYTPPDLELPLAEQAELSRRFLSRFQELRADPETAALYEQVRGYLRAVDSLGFTDPLLRAPLTPLGWAGFLGRHVLLMFVLLPLAIPGLLLHLPLLAAAVVFGDTIRAEQS